MGRALLSASPLNAGNVTVSRQSKNASRRIGEFQFYLLAGAAAGTVISAVGVFKALTGQLDSPFCAQGIATGLVLNTAVWFDLQIANITGGTASATALTCIAEEA